MNKQAINQEEAELLMIQFCEQHNYYFSLPVKIINRWRSWKIITNYGREGNNAWICIDKKTRLITDSGFLIEMNRDIAIEKARKFCIEEQCILYNGTTWLVREELSHWSINFIAEYKSEDCPVNSIYEITISVCKKTGNTRNANWPR